MTALQNERSTDEVLRALADGDRRLVVRELAERDLPSEVPVEILVSIVAKRAATDDRSESDVAIELRHVHLPTLDEAGLLDHDRRQGTVSYEADDFAESLVGFLANR